MPSDSGEKVTMGITTLLSMTVFLMLVAENMPPTSDVLPLIGPALLKHKHHMTFVNMRFYLLGLYYGLTIFIVSLATGCTVFTLNIHHKGIHGAKVPWLVRSIFLRFFGKILCMRSDLHHALRESELEVRGKFQV